MAFNTNPGRQSFTATAGQTIFNFNFKIFADTDIKVYLTPVGQSPDDAIDLLTYASDYTVTITGDTGGSITLLSGATLNDTLVLVRDLPQTRTTSYVTNGDLKAATLNEDQDYQTYLLVDGFSTRDRAVVIPETDVNLNRVLPATIPNGFLRINNTGTGFEYGSYSSDSSSVTADTIADMLAIDGSITGKVNVLGYYAKGDGGGGMFYWDPLSVASADNGVVFGTGTGRWIRSYQKYIFIKAFGAKGDGTTDDTNALNAAISYCKSGSALDGGVTLLMTKGVYCVSSTIVIDGQMSIIGEGFSKDHYTQIGVSFMTPEGTTIKNISVSALTNGVVSVETSLSSSVKTSGVYMKGIAILGEDNATCALALRSTDRCIFDDVACEGGTAEQVLLTAQTFSMPNSGARDTQHNLFRNLFAKATGSQHGVVLTTDLVGGNSSVNTFEYPYVRHANGTAYKFINADSNTIIHPRATRLVTDTGWAVEFNGSNDGTSMYARSNIMYHLTSSQGGVWSEYGDGSYPAKDNAIIGLNMDGGAPNITITVDAGSNMEYLNPRFSTINTVSSMSVKASDALYTTKNNAITQARAALVTEGNPNYAHHFMAGDGFVADWTNWSGITRWATTVQNTSGNIEFTQPTGTKGSLYSPSFSSKSRVITGTPITLTRDESVVLIDATGGNRTITLPLSTDYGSVKSAELKIVRIDASANTVTIQTQGTDTINGLASETLAVGQGKTYVSNGGITSWFSY